MGEIKGTTRVCGLIGNPVGHSISPVIHNTLADLCGIDMVYTTFKVEKGAVDTAVKGAHALDILGLNVTVPHKQEVIGALESVDPMAEAIGAVNTLVRTEHGYKGYNTDILGLERELEEEQVELKDSPVILLGASVKRIHRPVDAEGKTLSVGSYMIPLLEENCQKAGVQMMLNTTATEILTDDNGAAVGIKATGASGETITINAKAVVLTTGGFGANLDMVVEYKPELKGFMTTNAPGILGQGIKMAQAIGADTVDMDQIQIHPTVEANTAALITEGLRGDGAVLINAEGKRFIDEVGTRDVVSAAEIAQTGSYSWLVVDQAMVDASSVIQGYIKKGYTVTGETYEELGKAMGVDEAAFAETMNTWNGYVEAKNDPDFGRTSFANKLDTAPYYAIKVTAGVHHTMGGLKINTNTEVLNENGEVIPGLFAAGEVTGGVHGANRLGGNAVADFTVFGRIAGAAASKYAA